LGAAAALDFAGEHPVQRVVLVAPFTTLREVAARLFSKPASYLLIENYDNRSSVQELAKREPPPSITILHGTADNLIPTTMGRELAASAPGIARFIPFEGATHDTIVSAAWQQLIDEISRP
ncbi:MAG TPA: hypothetical protein VK993_12025, partial [Chthoniobacterales bacterium]|nr:hypothetical protein [Chthoniobacterales bacterium]